MYLQEGELYQAGADLQYNSSYLKKEKMKPINSKVIVFGSKLKGDTCHEESTEEHRFMLKI
jgi:hypothetical protein